MHMLHIVPSKMSDPDAYNVATQREPNEGDIQFSPDLAGDELALLSGSWNGHRTFFAALLPAVRKHLLSVALPKVDRVHVDLGDEVSTLYAAYYATIAQVPVMVTLHRPAIGGQSFWAETHPLVLTRVAMVVLARAHTIFVPDREVARFLCDVFPRLQRDFVGVPLNKPRRTAEEIAFLCSPLEGHDA